MSNSKSMAGVAIQSSKEKKNNVGVGGVRGAMPKIGMTLQDVQRNQAIQSAQGGVFDPSFDPDAILQEIANKDVQLQIKEQELAQREAGVQQGEQQIQQQSVEVEQQGQMVQQQGAELEQQIAQAGEQQAADSDKLEMAMQALSELKASKQQPVPVVPLKGPVPPPEPSGAQVPQQGSGDVSPQTMQNMQPGQEVQVSKVIVLTPNGPMEISRSEKIKGQQNQQASQTQQMS